MTDLLHAKNRHRSNVRLIARLDVKLQHLIKGIHLEGWRKMGDPIERARTYYDQGADEILYMDVVASLYQRNNLADIVKRVATEVFVPITVGGGVNSLEAVHKLLAVGADKIAINTAATVRPGLLKEISDTYGSQATVLSIEAKSKIQGGWEAMTDNGRNHTGRDVVEWAQEAESLGAGEILLTSIDKDGTGRGYELALLKAINDAVRIPVIASGGCAVPEDVADATSYSSAVAIAKALHSDQLTFGSIKNYLLQQNIPVRETA